MRTITTWQSGTSVNARRPHKGFDSRQIVPVWADDTCESVTTASTSLSSRGSVLRSSGVALPVKAENSFLSNPSA